MMGFLDRLLGREGGSDERPGSREPHRPQDAGPTPAYGTPPGRSARSEDEIAIERYRYLLRTAPPEAIEQVHREAFEQLTPQQRQQVFRELSEGAPAGDAPRGDDAASLATSATRSELRQPGFMERRFSGGGMGAGGMGLGGMFAGSMLGTIAGFAIGSVIADAFLPDASEFGGGEGADGGGAEAAGDGGDGGGGYDGGGDAGGFGDGGGFGDFGGGDFGGGDFGGGFDI